MTPEEQLRALLAAVEDMEVCPICDGPFVVGIPLDGGAPFTEAYHEDGCPAA